MIKKKLISLISVITLLTVMASPISSAYADEVQEKVEQVEKTITREFDFKTTNPKYKDYNIKDIGAGDLKEVPETIENGFFSLRRITDLKVSLNNEDKETKVEKEFEGLTEKKIPEDTIKKDGKELKLLPDEIIWTPTKRTLAEGTMTIRGVEKEPTFPDTKDITITINGVVTKVPAKRYDIKKSEGYTKDVVINARFLGDEDADEYTLNGAVIPVNRNYPEYKGYERVILEAYGRDPDKHIITGSKWTSDYIYVESDDTYMRRAVFYAKRYSTDYTAYYRETLPEGGEDALITSYNAVAVYSDQKESVYDVHVVAEYGKVELILTRVIIAAGLALLFFAIIIALIAAFFSKKKKKEQEVVVEIV